MMSIFMGETTMESKVMFWKIFSNSLNVGIFAGKAFEPDKSKKDNDHGTKGHENRHNGKVAVARFEPRIQRPTVVSLFQDTTQVEATQHRQRRRPCTVTKGGGKTCPTPTCQCRVQRPAQGIAKGGKARVGAKIGNFFFLCLIETTKSTQGTKEFMFHRKY